MLSGQNYFSIIYILDMLLHDGLSPDKHWMKITLYVL